MEAGKKPSRTLYYVPGIIVICMGLVILTAEVPSEEIRFGADFYTESYQAIAAVARILKNAIGTLIIALGIDSLLKGAAEAKQADLVLERLDAIREAVAAGNVPAVAAAVKETVLPQVDAPVAPEDVPTPEPVAESDAETVAEPDAEVVAEPEVEAAVEPVAEAAVEPEVEAAVEPELPDEPEAAPVETPEVDA